ncbi:Eco57I restriction-modification methylase domain-containing protein [Thermodesulfobacteriota bacterium]
MKYTTIRIEGSILSADILDKIEQGEVGGQLSKDFGFDSKIKVKDEIARTWADAQDLWRIFKRQKEKVTETEYGTSETRRYWIIPLLGLLGFDIQLSKAEIVNGKSYAVSHRASNLGHYPVHVVGFNDSLDKKRDQGGTRMSPHALLQEYINVTEHLYTIVTNGNYLRLLRDSSRLIKLSFIEFDLETMMEEEHYADFAIMFRLLHVSRMPLKMDLGAESLIEKYHQDALDSGSRIREGLSEAVENSIQSLSNGFLQHPDNNELRDLIETKSISESHFYQYQLRIIYRLLFLMVIEERNLIFPENGDKTKRDIYYEYYSVDKLRKLCEKQYLADKRFNDLWISLKNTFSLFQDESRSSHLGIKPLAGDLFSYNAIAILNKCNLDNSVLLKCLRNLSVFINKNTGQKMRVNYAALNVEEFGSVYEGLLEYDPEITKINGYYNFDFVKGSGRSSSGSHYTPDELVQPLIKHSLDYIIKEKLDSAHGRAEKEENLLSIKVCDVACGSGHILLNAARRIATELACVRTGEEQPSPSAFRKAVRDVIRNCIYGVDVNPLAVELCKVAMWLEAHNPNEPLNFLDHRIKCGNAIVGLAHQEELENGIPMEAFKRLSDDDKDIVALLRKRNKEEINNRKQQTFDFEKCVGNNLKTAIKHFNDVLDMPERTPEEISTKQKAYQKLQQSPELYDLNVIADIRTAQFFIPKTKETAQKVITNELYWRYLRGELAIQGQAVAKSMAVGREKRFFHWFLEFPKVFAEGGFDCILGNPPYLGGSKISGTFGKSFLNFLKTSYPPIGGQSDYVTYFLRRIFDIIKYDGFLALLSTNTICQGDTRKGGLDVILKDGNLTLAIKSLKWPGKAVLEISLFALKKGDWNGLRLLGNKKVDYINSYFNDEVTIGDPFVLAGNKKKSFKGSDIMGAGFILTKEQASTLISNNKKNEDVIFPFLNGSDLNNHPEQRPSRYIINFFDWELEKASEYEECFSIIEDKVKPERETKNRERNRKLWWIYCENRPGLYSSINGMDKFLIIAATSKTVAFTFIPNGYVYSKATIVFPFDEYSIFSILQSTFHNQWAWKYGSTMKTDLSYTSTDVFETFPFPQSFLSLKHEAKLEDIGEKYHEFRHKLMQEVQLGLTKIYNQFHNPQLREIFSEEKESISSLSSKDFQKKYGKETVALWNHLNKIEGACEFNEAANKVFHLRKLHKQMDEAVLEAYGWHEDSKYGPAINLDHDFYEVDYLPENDRIRYTISLEARKEILKRLLLLNHEIHEKESKGNLKKEDKTNSRKTRNKNNDPRQMSLLS